MLTNKKRIYKIIFYILLTLLFFIMQTTYNFLPTIYGYRIDLLPTVFIAVCVCDNIYDGVVLAVFTGILYDFTSIYAQGIYPLFFIISAIVICVTRKKYFSENFITNTMYVTMITLFEKIILYALTYFNGGKVDFLIYFKVISAETLITVGFSFITYLLIYLINNRFYVKVGGID